jgi:hypothetical protein
MRSTARLTGCEVGAGKSLVASGAARGAVFGGDTTVEGDVGAAFSAVDGIAEDVGGDFAVS